MSFTKKKKDIRSHPQFGQFCFHEFYKVYEMYSMDEKDVTNAFSLLCYFFLPISLIEQNIRQAVQCNAIYVSDMDFLQYINIIWFKCWIFLRFSMIWDANFKEKKSFILCQDMCNK